MRSSELQLSEPSVQVLLLGMRADSVSLGPPWPDGLLPIRLRAASPEAVDSTGLPYRVRLLRPVEFGPSEAPRSTGAWVKTRITARKAGVRGDWLWIVKRDQWLRKRLGRTDVLVSMDADTDQLLPLVPELWNRCALVRFAERVEMQRNVEALENLLSRLSEIVDHRRASTGIERRALDDCEWAGLVAIVDRVSPGSVPGAILPTVEVADVVRTLGPALGQADMAKVVLEILGRFPWEDARALGCSGLAAQRANARLVSAVTASDVPGDKILATVSNAALSGADEALTHGNSVLARGRLGDAMSVIFHRERHAAAVSSPLVTDPAGHLEALWSNQTFRQVVTGGEPPRLRAIPSRVDGPRVLALAGAYGSFHGPVVTALSTVTKVTVRDPKMVTPFFTRGRLDPQAVEALVALRGGGAELEESDPWGAIAVHQEIIRLLGARLRRADVVFTDWADRLTVWASHLVPDGVRLVVRIHSLDALDPWFHLVDWTSVDHVLVVSEPLRRLADQMLKVAGADVPVTIVPNLAALQAVDQPKEPQARMTLGMVGWGRRVKDPLWALDLLARLPAWRLLLIGPDLESGLSGMAHAYAEQVRVRLLDPALRSRVEVVGWTDDVAEQLRRVGVILSTSRRESWHLGLVEGAASGAVPVVRDWPVLTPVGGARALFPDDWVVDDLDAAEVRVRSVAEPVAWESARRRAQDEARSLFDPEAAAQRYRELILGPLWWGQAQDS